MIREYITGYLKSKLRDHPTLVIYDAGKLYTALLPELADARTKVFDISTDILSQREDALEYYNSLLPADSEARMVLYIPFAPPATKQEKIDDPFFIFTFGGCYFPFDANDTYESLCKACMPDKEKQIAQLFEEDIPDFDTIDALGGGHTSPKLQTLTGCKSEKEIFEAIMNPSNAQKENLKKDKTWQKEYKEIARPIGLEAKEKSFDDISYELWRFMLYSEFVFDLPIELPAQLKSVAMAKHSARSLVFDICRSLRNNKTCEDIYVENAEKVALELSLPTLFKNENNLGEIITFSFEDNTYFFHFTTLLLSGKTSEANSMVAKSKENIWLHHDSERGRYWKMAETGCQLIQLSKKNIPATNSLKALIDLYATELYKIDQLQRRFEKLHMEVLQPTDDLQQLVKLVRETYNTFTEKVQKKYQQLFSDEHWPVTGMQANLEVFTKHVQPLLKSNTRSAYLLIDALRFELAKELEDQLEKHFNIQLIPSCAYLPTVTKFGMAALLPEAEKQLHLERHEASLEAFMEEKALLNLIHRKEYLKKKLGDRCAIVPMDKLVSSSTIEEVDLLIVTTNEIDNAGENLASNSIHAMHQAVQNLVKAIFRLSQHGYKKIVIATDHGFVLHPVFQPGDNVSKPAGEWIMNKSRSLAGQGAIPAAAMGFSAQQIGVRSAVKDFVFLKGYAVFEKNTNYFHEGLSLQENIVPVMLLSPLHAKKEDRISINATYKGKTKAIITSRRPSVEIASFIEGKLGFDPIVIRIEAIAEGKIVGLPSSDEKVNEVTKLVEIYPGQAYKIAMDMDADFEGDFEVRITDPVSNITYSTITLQTDYVS